MAPSKPRQTAEAAPMLSDPERLDRLMVACVEPAWYLLRHPDIAAAAIEPVQHFIRFGAEEKRDPNRFFDSAWYAGHYPDVAASGLSPLAHYLRKGAAEGCNPHPRFDAAWYVGRYPEAADNPLLYHLQVGYARGYPTEKPVEIRDYLPAGAPTVGAPRELAVDIVIPVYRGLAETQRCLRSVLADQNRPPGEVIVVEDRSPEPALVKWLQDLAAKGRIRLMCNPHNQGFVAAVNRGMQAAGDHDVALLNSDTVVPEGWLGRLAAQAYAEPDIASVSPLSNNATFCGYPGNAGGPVVFGQGPVQVDEACRAANAGRFIEVPATQGFCMYIRRQALREAGHFDAKLFITGYGTETDFCLRSAALGWRHRLACDTFVYHKGSVSFGDRAPALAARAAALIQERHPNYPRKLDAFLAGDTAAAGRFAVTAALFRASELPVILMVSHDLGGGVRRHIEALVERYRDTARILLLEGTIRGAALSVPALPGHPVLTLPSHQIDDMAQVLRSAGVSRVHIHHLVRVDMDISRLIQRLGVPFDVTVHDYLAICPQINLLPWPESLYCGEPDIAGCNACIAQSAGMHEARDILSWRRERAWQFQRADRVICPSADVRDRLQRFGVGDRAVVAPHEASAATAWHIAAPRVAPRGAPSAAAKAAHGPAQGALRVVLLGALANHKGSRTVAAVAAAATPGTLDLHVIGYLEDTFPPAAAKLISQTGPYEDSDLPRLLREAKPHVIWLPSSCPETYSYTLSTAIAAGLPVVATRLGSFPERLAGRPFSWLVEHQASAQECLAVFRSVRQALLEQPRKPAVWPRQPIADFYADQYLLAPSRPATLSRPAVRRGKKPVVAIVPERFQTGALSPCAYIRLLQPLDHPAIADGFSVMLGDPESVLDCKADIIVTQRYALPDIPAADALAAHARRTGATLLYDLDDDLLNIPRTHPDAEELRPKARVVRRMLDHADAVWVSTPGLAVRLSPIRPDAVVIENGLDERIWTHRPDPDRFQADPLRILCMGTSTHDRDFALIQPALGRLKAEHGERVVIDVLGMTNRTDLPDGVNRIGPSIHGRQSYPGFVHWITSVARPWHIGLAPLLDTPFNGAKSAIKAMDYAALGLVVMASDTPVYQGSIADGAAGQDGSLRQEGAAGQLVPNDADAWYEALAWMLRDQDRRRRVAARSRAAFLARGSLASQATARRAAWLRLLQVRQTVTAA